MLIYLRNQSSHLESDLLLPVHFRLVVYSITESLHQALAIPKSTAMRDCYRYELPL